MKIELILLDPRIDGMHYGSEGAAACDLRACRLGDKPLDFNINMHPGHKVKIGAGFAMHLAPMMAALILPRSGLGSAGIRLSNVVGLIDSDYQGEIIVALENQGTEVFVLEPMMRIAQLLITPYMRPEVSIVREFSIETDRGTGGFGSTGHE